MLLEQISKDRIAAMKRRDAQTKSVLTTLKGEIERVYPKGATDEEVQKVIKAMLKRLNETKDALIAANKSVVEQDLEIAILLEYMPQELDEFEIRIHIQDALAIHGNTKASMGKIMGFLKGIEGMNMGVASTILKEILV